MALQAVFHFKDGTTGVVPSAVKGRPFLSPITNNSDDNFVEVLDNSTPGVPLALASVVDLNWVEFQS